MHTLIGSESYTKLRLSPSVTTKLVFEAECLSRSGPLLNQRLVLGFVLAFKQFDGYCYHAADSGTKDQLFFLKRKAQLRLHCWHPHWGEQNGRVMAGQRSSTQPRLGWRLFLTKCATNRLHRPGCTGVETVTGGPLLSLQTRSARKLSGVRHGCPLQPRDAASP